MPLNVPTPVASSLRTWLPLIQTQLQTVTGLPPERTNVTIRLNPPMGHLQDLLIFPREITGRQDFLIGSGRLAPVVKRNLWIIVRTRLAIDAAETDLSLLTDATLGHLQLEDLVYDALQGFQPTDKSSNVLLVAPLNFVGGPTPYKDEKVVDMGQTILVFEAEYILPFGSINTPNF